MVRGSYDSIIIFNFDEPLIIDSGSETYIILRGDIASSVGSYHILSIDGTNASVNARGARSHRPVTVTYSGDGRKIFVNEW